MYYASTLSIYKELKYDGDVSLLKHSAIVGHEYIIIVYVGQILNPQKGKQTSHFVNKTNLLSHANVSYYLCW